MNPWGNLIDHYPRASDSTLMEEKLHRIGANQTESFAYLPGNVESVLYGLWIDAVLFGWTEDLRADALILKGYHHRVSGKVAGDRTGGYHG
jgi:hypothetical protein